jgi:hypothetical protein
MRNCPLEFRSSVSIALSFLVGPRLIRFFYSMSKSCHQNSLSMLRFRIILDEVCESERKHSRDGSSLEVSLASS